MPLHGLLRSPAEQQNVVLINSATPHEAERLIASCEHCNLDGAEIPFDNILDRVTGSEPSVTDYVLEHPAKCPNCCREILEETLVERKRMSIFAKKKQGLGLMRPSPNGN